MIDTINIAFLLILLTAGVMVWRCYKKAKK